MNKIYKVIWSKVKGCYVVVSEIAKSNGKSKSTGVKLATKSALSMGVIGSLLMAVAPFYTAEAGYENWVIVKDGSITTKANGSAKVEGSKDDDLMVPYTSRYKYAVMLNPSVSNQDITSDSDSGNLSHRGSVGERAIAIGVNTQASEYSSIAIGATAQSDNRYGIAIGDSSRTGTTGMYSTAIGTTTFAGGYGATTIGSYSAVGKDLYNKNWTAGDVTNYYGTALGYKAMVAKGDRNVALGAYSTAEDSPKGEGSTFGGEKVWAKDQKDKNIFNPFAVVSIGDAGGSYVAVEPGIAPEKVTRTAFTRRIINMSAGIDDTDAVNMAQLRSLAANKIKLEDNEGAKTTGISLGDENDHNKDRLTFKILGENGVTTKATGADTITIGIDPSKLGGGSADRAFNTDRGNFTVKNAPVNVLGGYNQDNNPQYWKNEYKKATGVPIGNNDVSSLSPELANKFYEAGLTDGNIAVYKDPAKNDTMYVKLAKNVQDLDSVRIGKKTPAEALADSDKENAVDGHYKIILEGQDGSITSKYVYTGTEDNRKSFVDRLNEPNVDHDYGRVSADDVQGGALMTTVAKTDSSGNVTGREGYVISDNVVAKKVVANNIVSLNRPNNTTSYDDADMASGMYNGAVFTATRDNSLDQNYRIKSILDKNGLITNKAIIGDAATKADDYGNVVRDDGLVTNQNSIIIEKSQARLSDDQNHVKDQEYREISGLSNIKFDPNEPNFDKFATSNKAATEAQLKAGYEASVTYANNLEMQYGGDNTATDTKAVITRNKDQRLDVVGGKTSWQPETPSGASVAPAAVSNKNITTTADKASGKIEVALNPELKGLKSVETDSLKTDKLKVTGPATFDEKATFTEGIDLGQNGTISGGNAHTGFMGDSGSVKNVNLGSTLNVTGGVEDPSQLVDNNIGVVSNDNGLQIKLAKNLSNLGVVAAGEVSANTVQGLTNKDWDKENAETNYKDSNKAATEAQVYKAGEAAVDKAVNKAKENLDNAERKFATDNSGTVSATLATPVGVKGGTTTFDNPFYDSSKPASDTNTQTTNAKNITTKANGNDIEVILNKDLKVETVSAKDITAANKIATKDLEATGNTKVNNLEVGGKSTFKDEATFEKGIKLGDNQKITGGNAKTVYQGDAGDVNTIALGETLNVKGNVQNYDAGKFSDGDIAVVGATGNGGLNIKLSKNLNNLETVTASGIIKGGTLQTTNGTTTITDAGVNTNTVTASGNVQGKDLVANGTHTITVSSDNGTVTGLTNTDWTPGADGGETKYGSSNTAATEAQVYKAAKKATSDALDGAKWVIASKNGDSNEVTAEVKPHSQTDNKVLIKSGNAIQVDQTDRTLTIGFKDNSDLKLGSGSTINNLQVEPGNNGEVSRDINTAGNKSVATGGDIHKAVEKAKADADEAAAEKINAAKRKFTSDSGNIETTLGTPVGVVGGNTVVDSTVNTDKANKNISTKVNGTNIEVALNNEIQVNTVTTKDLKATNGITTNNLTTTGTSNFNGPTNFNSSATFTNGATFNQPITTHGINNTGTITSSGDITSNGKVTGATVESKGGITAGGDITTQGKVSAKDIEASNKITTKDLQVNGNLTGNNINTKYQGDNTEVTVTRNLSEVLKVTGGATGDVAEGLIKVTGDQDGGLKIQLAKDLTGLNTVNATTVTGGTINSTGGITAGGDITTENGTVKGNNVVAKEKVKTKDLEATGTTSLKNTTVGGTLNVTGATTTSGGITNTGGLTTDTLKTTGESTFEGKSTFKNGLEVTNGDTKVKNFTAEGTSTLSTTTVTGPATFTNTATFQQGANMSNQKITNVANGTDPNDAVNKSQLDAVANKGWDVKAKGQTATVTPDGNKNNVTFAADDNLDVDLNKDTRVVTYKLKKEVTGLTSISADKGNIGGVDFKGGNNGVNFGGNSITTTGDISGGNITGNTITGTTIQTSGNHPVIIKEDGTVNGLTNTDWISDKDQARTAYENSGKAATEAQVYKAATAAANATVGDVERNFVADSGTFTPAKLSDKVGILGGKTAVDNAVSVEDVKNITTDANGKNISVKLAKDIKVDSVTAKDLTAKGKVSTNELETTGKATFNGPTEFKGTNVFKGDTSFTKPITTNGINNNGDISTNTLHTTGDATVNGNLEVNGNITGANVNTKYQGDNGSVVLKRNLGETLKILGGASSPLTDSNISVIGSGEDTLTVKLAKNLSGLGTVATEKVTASNSIETKDLKATGDTSLKNTVVDGTLEVKNTSTFKEKATFQNGADMDGNKITGVAKGTEAGDAVNKGQLDEAVANTNRKFVVDNQQALNATAKDTVGVLGGTTSTSVIKRTPGTVPGVETETTIQETGKNIVTTVSGNNISVALSKDLSGLNSLQANEITAHEKVTTRDLEVKNNATVEKDLTVKGDTKLNKVTVEGPATFRDTATFEKGIQLGENQKITGGNAKTVYQGDDGENVTRPLGDTLKIKGNATGNLATKKNIKVVKGAGDDELNINLVQNLDGLTSVTATGAIKGGSIETTAGGTTINDTDGVKTNKVTVGGENGVQITSTPATSGTTPTNAINGLSNTDWNTGNDGGKTEYENSKKAATEAQVYKASKNAVDTANRNFTADDQGSLSATLADKVGIVGGATATEKVKVQKPGTAEEEEVTQDIKNISTKIKDKNVEISLNKKVRGLDSLEAKEVKADKVTTKTLDLGTDGKITGGNAKTVYTGDIGGAINRDLGVNLDIKGGVSRLDNLTTGNIGVVGNQNGGLTIQLAKSLTGLQDITATGTITGGKGVFGNTSGYNGITINSGNGNDFNAGIKGTKPSDTAKKLSAEESKAQGAHTINGLSNTRWVDGYDPTDGTQAATEGQLHDLNRIIKQVQTGAEGGWTAKVDNPNNITSSVVNKEDPTLTFKSGDQIAFAMEDNSNTVTANVKTGANVTLGTNSELTGDDVEVDNQLADGNPYKGETKRDINNKGDKHIATGGDIHRALINAVDKAVPYINAKIAGAERKFDTDSKSPFTVKLSDTLGVKGGETVVENPAYNADQPTPGVDEKLKAENIQTSVKDTVNGKDIEVTLSNKITVDTVTAKDITANNKVSTKDLTATGNTELQTLTVKDTATFEKPVTFKDTASFEKEITTKGINNTGDIDNSGKITSKDIEATNNLKTKDLVVTGTITGTNVNTKYKGDNDLTITRNLSEVLNVKGGADANSLTDNNIGVIGTSPDTLTVKLAKNLSNLGTVSAENLTASGTVQGDTLKTTNGKTTITNDNGVVTNKVASEEVKVGPKGSETTTINGDGVKTNAVTTNKLTVNGPATFTNTATFQKGADMNNNRITKVAAGTEKTDAVNKGQLDDAVSTSKREFMADKNVPLHATASTTVGIVGGKTGTTAKNIVTTVDGDNIVVSLAPKVDGLDSLNAGNITASEKVTTKELEVKDNATVDKNLEVKGDTTVKKLTAKGDTDLQKLTVNGESTFKEKATFEKGIDLGNNGKITGGNANTVYSGDAGTTNTINLGETLNIKGNITLPYKEADFIDGNIAVVGKANNGGVDIRLAKNLAGLTSVKASDAITGGTLKTTNGNTTITDNDGVVTNKVTVGKDQGVTITSTSKVGSGGTSTVENIIDNLSNKDWDKEHAATKYENSGKAATEAQVYKAATAAANATVGDVKRDFAADSGPFTPTKLSDKVGILGGETLVESTIEASGKAKNIETEASGSNIKVKLADKISVNGVTAKEIKATDKITTDKLETTGAATFGGDAKFNGTATFSKPIITNGITNTGGLQTDTLTTTGDATIGKDLKVTGKITGANVNTQYQGDYGDVVKRNLSEVLTVKGGAVAGTELVSGNIGVTNDGTTGLKVQLAKNLTGLGDITAGGTITGGTIHSNGEVTAAGNITSEATVQGKTVHATEDVTADRDVKAANDVKAGKDVVAVGDIKTTEGTVSGKNVSASEKVTTKDLKSTGKAELQDATVAGNLGVTGKTTTNGIVNTGDIKTTTLTTTGTSTFGDKATFNNGLEVKEGDTKVKNFTATGDTSLEKLTVNGPATFSNTATFTKGADMNHQKITNVAAGEDATDAVNKGQLDAVVNAGWDIKANNKTAKVTQKDQKNDATFAAGSNLTVDLDEATRKVTYTLANDLTGLNSITSTTGNIGGVNFKGNGQGVDFGTNDITTTGTVTTNKLVVKNGTNTITADSTTGTISGLTNTTWDESKLPEYQNSNKAATEAQIYHASEFVANKTVGAVKRNFTADDGNTLSATLATPVGVKGGETEVDKAVDTTGKKKNINTKVNGNDIDVTLNDSIEVNSVKAKNVEATDKLKTKDLQVERNATFNGDVTFNKNINLGPNGKITGGNAYTQFMGDTGTAAKIYLGNQLNVTGGVTTEDNLTAGNIGVVAGTDGLNIRLAKNLTGLGDVTATGTVKAGTLTTTNGKTKITDNDGIATNKVTATESVKVGPTGSETTTINANGVDTNAVKTDKVTVKGDNGKDAITLDKTNGIKLNGDGTARKISGVADATANDEAVNLGQLNSTVSGVAMQYGGDNTATSGDIIKRTSAQRLDIIGGATTWTPAATDAAPNPAIITNPNITTHADQNTGKISISLNADLKGLKSVDTNTVTTKELKVDGDSTFNGKVTFKNEVNLGDNGKITGGNAKTVYQGDDNQDVTRNLGDTLKIKGGVTGDAATANNIKVVKGNSDGELNINLAKDLQGLENIKATGTITGGTIKTTNGNTKIDDTNGVQTNKVTVGGDNGIKITSTPGADTPNTISGLSNTDWDKDNAKAKYEKSNKAATESQVYKATADIANVAGKKRGYKGDAGAEVKVALDGTLNLNGGVTDTSKLSDNNIGVVTNADNNGLNIKLAKDIKLDSVTAANTVQGGKLVATGKNGLGVTNTVTVDGANGTVNGLTNKDWDPNKIVSGRAATEDQLKLVDDSIAKKAADAVAGATRSFSAENADPKTNKNTITPKLSDTVGIVGANSKGAGTKNITTAINGNNIEISLDKDLKGLDSITANGKIDAGVITASGKDALNHEYNVIIGSESDAIAFGKDKTKEHQNGVIRGLKYYKWDPTPGILVGDRAVSEAQLKDALRTAGQNQERQFAGDDAKNNPDKVVKTDVLHNRLNIIGGATGPVADNNIKVVVLPKVGNEDQYTTLKVQLAEDLNGINSVNFKNDGLKLTAGDKNTPAAISFKDGVEIKPDTITFKDGVKIDPNTITFKNDGLKLTGGDNTTPANITFKNGPSITAGLDDKTPGSINMNKGQINNLADGLKDSDAINLGQLKASNREIAKQMGKMNADIHDTGALAGALAGLKPVAYDPYEPSQIMGAVGVYKGSAAIALGLAHYDNEANLVHAGLAYSGRGNIMANVGYTAKFGYRGKKDSDYRAEYLLHRNPIDQVKGLTLALNKMETENNELKSTIETQDKTIKEQNAKLDSQQQQIDEQKALLAKQQSQIDAIMRAMQVKA